MKVKTVLLLLIAVTVSAADFKVLNPQRFTSDQVRFEGATQHLQGHVVLRMRDMTIYADDLSWDPNRSALITHGDSRIVLRGVEPNPRFTQTPMDPKRFVADAVTQNGDITTFKGNVRIPASLSVYANEVALDTVTTTLEIKGDARLAFQLACHSLWKEEYGSEFCPPADDLGDLLVTNSSNH